MSLILLKSSVNSITLTLEGTLKRIAILVLCKKINEVESLYQNYGTKLNDCKDYEMLGDCSYTVS